MSRLQLVPALDPVGRILPAHLFDVIVSHNQSGHGKPSAVAFSRENQRSKRFLPEICSLNPVAV
jgi:hypothetical protein